MTIEFLQSMVSVYIQVLLPIHVVNNLINSVKYFINSTSNPQVYNTNFKSQGVQGTTSARLATSPMQLH